MGKKKKKTPGNVLFKNRKAFHDYHIFDTFEAGIELKGTEVKSCRARNISLIDSFAKIENGEIYLYNAHIAEYQQGNRYNHDPKRRRRLLMRKNQILGLSHQTKEKGQTLIPIKFYLKRGRVKVEIALAKGKRQYDKRETLKRKQDDREAKQAMDKINTR